MTHANVTTDMAQAVGINTQGTAARIQHKHKHNHSSRRVCTLLWRLRAYRNRSTHLVAVTVRSRPCRLHLL
jgi:hypothetical protein